MPTVNASGLKGRMMQGRLFSSYLATDLDAFQMIDFEMFLALVGSFRSLRPADPRRWCLAVSL